eukprot:750627-Hanusia_phi.AAC.16
MSESHLREAGGFTNWTFWNVFFTCSRYIIYIQGYINQTSAKNSGISLPLKIFTRKLPFCFKQDNLTPHT